MTGRTVGERERQACRFIRDRGALVGVAGALFFAAVPPRVAAGDGPKIVPESHEHDFGRVPNDRSVEHVFAIANEGDKPLVVSRVQTSCGCTGAMMESSVVDPGESGRLRVSFNAQGRRGRTQRTVTIHSNDPARPSLRINVSADVVPADEFEAPPPPQAEREHAPEGKLVFKDACLKCHGPGRSGELGRDLFRSACAACHGRDGKGWKLDDEVIGPSLALPRMTVKSREGVRQSIAAGTGHPAMPGFSREYQGPLSDAQIDSLVHLILEQFPAP